MNFLPSALVNVTSLSKLGIVLSKDRDRRPRLCAAVLVLAATTLLPYAAAQPLRNGSGTGSDASSIGVKSIAVSDAVAVPLDGPEPSGVLVGASTTNFLLQGSGGCTDSNGRPFSRIGYSSPSLDECKARCSTAPFQLNLVGLTYTGYRRRRPDLGNCACRFDAGAPIINSKAGDDTCPSDAVVGPVACVRALNVGPGPVTGPTGSAECTIYSACIVCYRNIAYVAPAVPRVDVTGVEGYHDVGEGLYFSFEPSQFRALGLGLEQGGVYSVKQCGEDGGEIWSGSISVGTAYGPWYGRRQTSPAAEQWTVNDYIVKPGDEC